MGIKRIDCKLGNMRKVVDWVVCPVSNADEDTIYIQSAKRICRFNAKTGEGMLSKGGRTSFMDLHDFRGAVPVQVPQEVIDAATEATPKSGDHIGGGVYVA
jgi:hypothetical protein